MIKYLFSKLFEKNVGVLGNRKTLDDLVSSIFEITKSHSQYNKNIEKLTLTEDYYLTIVTIIKQQNNLSLLNLTKVLHTLRCVKGLRYLNHNEMQLRDIAFTRAPNLLTQPFSTVCDTYCNIALLQGNTDVYAENILNGISDKIQEVDFLKIQRAMVRRNLSPLEQEIIKKMQRIDIFNYTIPARIRIFRYYAEMQTLHRAPFYDVPEQQRQIENKTKKLIQFTIPDVYISYQSICSGFSDKILKLANQQLKADNSHQSGPFNFEQCKVIYDKIVNLFSLCLREASKIESLQETMDWDQFLKEYIYQLQTISPEIPSHLSLSLFGRIFMDKINEGNSHLLNDIVQIAQKHNRLIKNINFIQFMYLNRNTISQNTMTQFKEIFHKIPNDKKDSLIFNYISQKLGFKKVDFQQSFYSNLRTLSQNCICDDDYNLEICQQIQSKDQKFLLNHLDIIISSVCGIKTLQFWQDQLLKINQIEIPKLIACLEELLSNNCLDFPNYYNYYQLKLFLWIFDTFKLPPFTVAPYFYRKLSKNLEFSTNSIKLLEQTDLHTGIVIWEQMECPAMLLPVLSRIFDKTQDFKLTPPIQRFIKSQKSNFTDQQSQVIAAVFNLKP